MNMNFQQKIVIIVLDILILVQLCISIYAANLDSDNFTPIFFKYFMAMIIPTLIAARIAVKRLRSPRPEPAR